MVINNLWQLWLYVGHLIASGLGLALALAGFAATTAISAFQAPPAARVSLLPIITGSARTYVDRRGEF